jgi:DNA-binding MarR family transcriptional regulator
MAQTPDSARSAHELRTVLAQLVRRLRSEHTVPLSHGAVLGRLDREGALTTSELAAAERMRPQSMAQTLGELEADGLVSRRPHPHDRRSVLIDLTDEGREHLRAERTRREDWLARAIATELSPAEHRNLMEAVALLERLARS